MSLRFENHKLRWFVDDREFSPISVTDFTSDEDRRIDSAKYMGKKDPIKDSARNGWTFSFSFEVNPGDVDMEQAAELYRRGQDRDDGTGRTEFVESELIDGVEIAYRYFGVHWTISKSAGGDRKTTRQIRGEAERRERI